jgi:hypothetical protein
MQYVVIFISSESNYHTYMLRLLLVLPHKVSSSFF